MQFLNGLLRRTRQMLSVVLELFLVMGLTWLAEVISLVINWRAGRAYAGWEIIVFDIINSLQGLLIFLVLICKPRMRHKIRDRKSTRLNSSHSQQSRMPSSA